MQPFCLQKLLKSIPPSPEDFEKGSSPVAKFWSVPLSLIVNKWSEFSDSESIDEAGTLPSELDKG